MGQRDGREPHEPTAEGGAREEGPGAGTVRPTMAAEAFDPFASDEDDGFPPPPAGAAFSPAPAPDASAPRGGGGAGGTRGARADDASSEFGAAFPPRTLDDGGTDPFGFPPSCFPAAFEGNAPRADADASGGARSSLEGVAFVVAEEMSVIHKSQTNQCSVKVRGTISLEASSRIAPGQSVQCDVTVLDPNRHLGAADSKNYDYAQPIALAKEFTSMNPVDASASDAAFRISLPKAKEPKDGWLGRPLIEYTCTDELRPVPMLISTNARRESKDHRRIALQLRVNPRNANPLSNAVVLASVPEEFDGETALVRESGKGDVDVNWSDLARVLSWNLGELGGGAVREFEAVFPPSDADPAGERGRAGATFPVLVRYDSEGSVLSGVDLDFGEEASPPSVKRKFRVYHREV